VNSLEEYLNDPNFEENRLEYKANKAAADGKPVQRQKTRPASPSRESTFYFCGGMALSAVHYSRSRDQGIRSVHFNIYTREGDEAS